MSWGDFMREIIGYKKRSYILHIMIIVILSSFLPLTLVYLRTHINDLRDFIIFIILGIYIFGVSILLHMLYVITTPKPLIEIEHDMLLIHTDSEMKKIAFSDLKCVEAIASENNTKHAKLMIETKDQRYETEIVKNYQITCEEILKYQTKYQRIE